jgi:hypothetical protein
MTQTSEARQIETSHFLTLAPGEVRTFEHGSFVVKLFAVGGGSFTRLDVRDRAGKLFVERSGTYVHETDALRDYIAVLRWLLAQ